MRIDNVELTLFSWDDIPKTTYAPGSQNTSGRSTLGLLQGLGPMPALRATLFSARRSIPPTPTPQR